MIELLVNGCVGEGPSRELLGYLDDLDLPDPEALLAGRTSLPSGLRGDQLFVTLGSLTAAVAQHRTRERFEAAFALIADAATTAGVDVAAVAARRLLQLRVASWPLPPQVDRFVPILQAAGLLG